MKHILFLLVNTLLFSSNIYSNEIDNLYKELDKKISMREYYMSQKENKIDSLRKIVQNTPSLIKQYEINKLISKEYNTYKYDSAVHYVLKSLKIAEQLHNRNYINEARINFTMLLSTTGLINEAIDNIKSIERHYLDSTLLKEYYEMMEWVYYSAKNYSNDSFYGPQYEKIEREYVDSMYFILPPESVYHTYYEGYRYFRDDNLEEAEAILLNLFNQLPENERLYAIVSSNLATLYGKQGNNNLYEKHLIISAITDQVCSLKENSAMQRLAIYLAQYKPEELSRAYNYIICSMEDAQFYNNRIRIVQISEKLPIIISAYQKKSEQENKNLRVSLLVISFLTILMVMALTHIYNQMKLLKKKRKELSRLNQQLNALNTKLQHANHIREESVSLFIDLSSSYINRIEQFRETVKRRIIAKQIDELYTFSDSSEALKTILSSFLRNFDEVFLRLFPSFISDFNELLSDEGKIILKQGELLNTELRIFALIKLGISDSSKIAAFLHYSPQTIYNYRNKVKNYAIVDRDNFEKYVSTIGEIV